MKKFSWRLSRAKIRLIGWSVFGVFLLTVGLPLLFFYYFFDQNVVKNMIVSQINSKDYSVKIGGTIEPRSWHGLSLFIADLTVFDKKNQKVLHINTSNCQLSWLDLIVGHYRIRRIAMNGLTVFQNNVEPSNYSDLINYDNLAKSEFRDLKRISVSNLTILNQAESPLIKDASLIASELDKKNPTIKLDFKIAKYNADFGMFGELDKKPDNDTFVINHMKFTLRNPRYNIELQSGGHYDYRTQQLWLEAVRGHVGLRHYQGSLVADTALLSLYGLSVNQLQTTLYGKESYADKSISLNLQKLKTANFESYFAEDLSGLFDSNNKSHSFSLGIQIKNPSINGMLANNQQCKVNYKYVSQIKKVSSGSLQGKCSFNGNANQIKANVSGIVDKSPAKISALYQYGESSMPIVEVDGDLDKFDIDNFIDGRDNDLLPLYADTSPLAFAWLDVMNAKANVKIKQLSLEHLVMNDVNSSFTLTNGKLDVTNIQASSYDGKIHGNVQVTKLNESYDFAFNSQVTGINLQKVFNNLFSVSAIRGSANMQINTSVHGARLYKDLYNGLNGKIKLNVSNGGFNGIDFNLFLSPENLAAFSSQNQRMTNFTALEADFEFESGVSKQGVINFNSPTILAHGGGGVDFTANQINYNVMIKSILPENAQKVKSVSIPIVINGELFNPKIYIKNMTLNVTPELGNKTHKK